MSELILTTPEARAIGRMRLRREAITQQYNRLRDANVMCKIEDSPNAPDDVPIAITGTYKKEPFIVYYSFIFIGPEKLNQWTMVLHTRYKGQDIRGEKPIDVLRGLA